VFPHITSEVSAGVSYGYQYFTPAVPGLMRPILPTLSGAASMAPAMPFSPGPQRVQDGTGRCTSALYYELMFKQLPQSMEWPHIPVLPSKGNI